MNRSIIRWVMLGAVLLTFSVASFGQIAVGVSVRIGPPPLPVYAQPICPGPGYIWTPGYWAWNDDDGYYWVPGTWVIAPVGMLWTPGYWGWGGGFYVWHAGYWGPHVGFYGGINYGFGYTGVGFVGGEWRGRSFYYNRSVTNVSVTNVTNVYNRTVVVNNRSTVSYNGGNGGIHARPTRQEEFYGRERHIGALSSQFDHERAASRNRDNLAALNHGRPAIAATARPGDFGRRSVVSARSAGGEYRAPAMSPREARVNPSAGNRGNVNPGTNRSEGGFRPFTPPTRNGNANGGWNNRNTNNGRMSDSVNRGNHGRPNDNRPPIQNRQMQDRPQMQNRSQMQDRPGMQNRPQMQDRPGMQNRPQMQDRPGVPNRPQMDRPSMQNRPQMQSRPQMQRPPAQPRQAPRQMPQRANPAPQRQAPPPPHHGRG